MQNHTLHCFENKQLARVDGHTSAGHSNNQLVTQSFRSLKRARSPREPTAIMIQIELQRSPVIQLGIREEGWFPSLIKYRDLPPALAGVTAGSVAGAVTSRRGRVLLAAFFSPSCWALFSLMVSLRVGYVLHLLRTPGIDFCREYTVRLVDRDIYQSLELTGKLRHAHQRQ